MNIIFTRNGRVILFLVVAFQFGLKLQASAHTRMVSDTDTTRTTAAINSQTVKADTTLTLKAGSVISTIVKNSDTTMIINGLAAKVSKDGGDKDPATSLTAEPTGGHSEAASKGGIESKINDAATSYTAPPSDGVVQVKNNSTSAPTNTTIIGLPTDGVIQVRDITPVIKKADSVKADTMLKKDTSLMRKSDTTAMVKDSADNTKVKAKSYYLEVGGAGLAISANYDARFNKERNGWGYRIGLGGFIAGGNRVITVPFQVNYLAGEHSSMFEVGAGTTFLSSTGDNKGKTWEFDKITGFVATGSIGYRYQPQHKGIIFRIAFTPILYDEGIIPAGGISIGYTFK